MLIPPLTTQRQAPGTSRAGSSTFRPWATGCLLAANVLIWMMMLAQGAGVGRTPGWMLLAWGGNSTVAVQHGEWWRLATAMFLHGGGLSLLANLAGLVAAGARVERYYGAWAMLLVYGGSGLVGHALCLHDGAQGGVSVGASAAVAGLAGAVLVSWAMLRRQERAGTAGSDAASMPSPGRSGTYPLLWIGIAAWAGQAFVGAALADSASYLLSPAGILGGALTGSVLAVLSVRGGRSLDGGRGLAIAFALACASVVTIASTAPKAASATGAEARADAVSGAARMLQP